ncbi:hypothetical protein ABIF78_001999 [Bradyrhizobium japonicum]
MLRLDVCSGAHDPLHDGAAADLGFDRRDRGARAGRDAIGARLEFAIGQVFGLRWCAAGQFGFELRSLRLEIDPHQDGRDERDEQQRQDVAEHVGHGIAGRDIGLLLLQRRLW